MVKTLENLGDVCCTQLRVMTSARVSESLLHCRNCNEEFRNDCANYYPIKNTELNFRRGRNAYELVKR